MLEKEKRDRMQAETRLRNLEEQFTRYKRTHPSGSNVSEAALESHKVRTIQARTRRERILLKCELDELKFKNVGLVKELDDQKELVSRLRKKQGDLQRRYYAAAIGPRKGRSGSELGCTKEWTARRMRYSRRHL